MNFDSIVKLLGGWSLILIAISALISRLLTGRVLSSWRRDEQKQIEILRDQLANSRLAIEAAIHSHSMGQNLVHQKHIEAVERLWSAVLMLRNRLSQAFFLSDILLPEEYDHVLDRSSKLFEYVHVLSDDMITEVMSSVDHIEKDRPLLGDTLWFNFFLYRAFRGRAEYLLLDGVKKGHIQDWRTDSGIKELLEYALPREKVTFLLESGYPIGFLKQAANEIESLILKEIALVVSGEQSSLKSFEIATKLREVAASMKINGVQ